LRIDAHGGIARRRTQAILRQREQAGERRRCGVGGWIPARIEHGREMTDRRLRVTTSDHANRYFRTKHRTRNAPASRAAPISE
jgi:hypothetical protein